MTDETTQNHWPDWRAVAEPGGAGPQVTLLHQSDTLKVVLVGLGAGMGLPAHTGAAASFHILDGHCTVQVGDETVEASAGSTVVIPDGAQRGVKATSDVVFLGNLGDPSSEEE